MTPDIVKSKLRAALLHFSITLTVTAVAAWLVFFLWFPAPYSSMLGGAKLFILVVLCDMVLGPVLTLVAYSPTKRKRALLLDYSIIGGLQIAALLFGLYVTAQTRPVAVSFTADRFDVMTAVEIPKHHLDRAAAPYNTLSWSGPVFVWAKPPTNPAELSQLTLDVVDKGEDMQHRPYLYRSYNEAQQVVLTKAKVIAQLPAARVELLAAIEACLKEQQLTAAQVRWLPVKHRTGFWTALVRADNAAFIGYVAFDPY
jgi:hypothetical protein